MCLSLLQPGIIPQSCFVFHFWRVLTSYFVEMSPQFGSVCYFLIINFSYGLLAKIRTEAMADARAGGGTDKMRLEHIVVPKSKAMLKK